MSAGEQVVGGNVDGKVVLRASGIRKSFDGRVVLDGADIELRAGESVALEGANGSGKTTLLKILAGLTRPDSFSCFQVGDAVATVVDENGFGSGCESDASSAGIRGGGGGGGKKSGNGVSGVSGVGGRWERWSGVVYAHQTPHLFLATVLANAEYGARRRGFADARERAERALEWAGIARLAEVSARRLSGGEARRLALARAVAAGAELYLLDEPTAHLDDDGARRVLELTMKLRAEGATILAATHIPAPEWGRRLRLENGKVS